MWLALIHARMDTSTYWTSVFEGVAEPGKLSFGLAYAGETEYMRVPDNQDPGFHFVAAPLYLLSKRGKMESEHYQT